ncbi:cell division protein FtsZ [Candidatus Lariskella endosymbiont of Hedychridium roseum]|uniref:cell division protein FtsZ n=1 Tax=Candidatus Lariskella endosymbiont of Hedychridium roseum TaxID=3077949 RepID=UPI0030D130A4
MTLKISLPTHTELKPKLIVFGVGGAGGNAVNNMIDSQLMGVEFWVANTDAQALAASKAENKIQLGISSTKGLGAGSYPEVGKIAAEESLTDIEASLEGCHMLFIAAGMGGGTGTGAAPVIAEIAKRMGIIVVGVVTKPFHFEGSKRMKVAELGLEELSRYVDTLIVIPNQNLFRVANEKTTFGEAFQMADDVLKSGVRGVTDLITMPGLINLDFADIKAVMQEMGKAMMGTGEAEGQDRAIKAAEAAISNPLLDNSSMNGAQGVLINITGSTDMTLFEVDEAANRIKEEVDASANIIFGSAFDESLKGRIRVSVVATGIDSKGSVSATSPVQLQNRVDGQDVKYAKTQQPSLLDSANTQTQKHDFEKISLNSVANTTISEKSVFIPPKAIDPEEFDNHESVSQTKSAAPSDVKISGTFGRIFGGSEQVISGKNDSEQTHNKEEYKEDLFEIPAFLRKKNK